MIPVAADLFDAGFNDDHGPEKRTETSTLSNHLVSPRPAWVQCLEQPGGCQINGLGFQTYGGVPLNHQF